MVDPSTRRSGYSMNINYLTWSPNSICILLASASSEPVFSTKVETRTESPDWIKDGLVAIVSVSKSANQLR